MTALSRLFWVGGGYLLFLSAVVALLVWLGRDSR